MNRNLQIIQNELSSMKLDDSLLFLNHVLGVSREFTTDSVLGPVIAESSPPVLPHVVHFLAKQLILNGSNLGTRTLGWNSYCYLSGLCIELDDPIVHDPTWKDADPSGFFERLMAQQISPQRRNFIQKYGLALGLFRDVGTINWPTTFDLRVEIEKEIQVPLDQFMGMGHVAFALRTAKHQNNECMGTFTPMMLAEAFRQGIDFCVPEVWTPFLNRVTTDRDGFRNVCLSEGYSVESDVFEQFSFNPLRRFPITHVGEHRYLAVDPELIVERVTTGLFYDLFERDRTRFSERFGFAYEQFVGQLLGSVCKSECLWSAADWERIADNTKRQSMKMGDWAYIGNQSTVLFECKSLRPSLALTTSGSDGSIVDLNTRVASALRQLIGQSNGIQNGDWGQAGLQKAATVAVIVTYGKFYTLNGPFARKRIRQLVEEKGDTPIPFVVLSLDELDSVLRLVELGHSLEELIQTMASNEESFDPLSVFQEELKNCAVSSFTFSKGDAFLKQVTKGGRT